MSIALGRALENSEGLSMPYLYLLIAVALEVSGTMLLPVSQNFTRPLPTVSLIACYAASFYCLTFALNTLPIAVVYATWS
ncbi:MAG: SMR family transporter, partial [Luminiphilus sp.]